MTPHQANLFFHCRIRPLHPDPRLLGIQEERIRLEKDHTKENIHQKDALPYPVALIAIGIMTAAYLLQLPQMTTLVIITGAQLFLTLIANVILFSSWFQRYRVYPRGKELAAVVVLMYAVADLFMPSGIKYGVLVVGILVGCLLPDSWKVDD